MTEIAFTNIEMDKMTHDYNGIINALERAVAEAFRVPDRLLRGRPRSGDMHEVSFTPEDLIAAYEMLVGNERHEEGTPGWQRPQAMYTPLRLRLEANNLLNDMRRESDAPATGWDNPDKERARLNNISDMRDVHKQRGWGDIVDPDAELAAFLARCEAQDTGSSGGKKSTSVLHWCEGVYFVEIGPKVKPLKWSSPAPEPGSVVLNSSREAAEGEDE